MLYENGGDVSAWQVIAKVVKVLCGVAGRDLSAAVVIGGLGIAFFTLWEARQLLIQGRAVLRSRSAIGVDLTCFSYLFFYNAAVMIYGWYGAFRPLIWHAAILLIPYAFLIFCLFRHKTYRGKDIAQVAISSTMIPVLLAAYTFGPFGAVKFSSIGGITFGIEFFFLLYSVGSLAALYKQDRTLIRTIRATGKTGMLRSGLIATFLLSNGSWLTFAVGSGDAVLMALSLAGICICLKTLSLLVEQRKPLRCTLSQT